MSYSLTDLLTTWKQEMLPHLKIAFVHFSFSICISPRLLLFIKRSQREVAFVRGGKFDKEDHQRFQEGGALLVLPIYIFARVTNIYLLVLPTYICSCFQHIFARVSNIYLLVLKTYICLCYKHIFGSVTNIYLKLSQAIMTNIWNTNQENAQEGVPWSCEQHIWHFFLQYLTKNQASWAKSASLDEKILTAPLKCSLKCF